MMHVIWSYGLLGAFGLASGLFILGHLSLALAAVAFAALMIWLSVAYRLPSTTTLDKNRPASSRFMSILFWLTMLSFVVVDLLTSFANSLIFDGFPFDGPFQSFNPLRRMAQGEWPLVDFEYFHGNLLPVLLYPFYALLGKNLFSAELARHLLDLIFFSLAMVILGRGLFTERHHRRLFYLAFLFISLSNAVMTELQNPILSVHSTIIRTFPQIIAFVVAMHVVGAGGKRAQRVLLEAVLIGLAAAIVFLFTNEHGAYLAATVAATVLLLAPFRFAMRLSVAGAIVVTFVTALLGIEMMLGWDGPIAAIRNIVSDQVWYFGAYPNFFITQLSDLWENGGVYKLVAGIARLFVVVSLAGAVVWLALRDRRKEMAGLLALLVYGLFATASSLGYFGLHYFDPLVRALVVSLLYFVYLAGSYPERATNVILRRVFNAVSMVLARVRINLLLATIGVVGALWFSAKTSTLISKYESLPYLAKHKVLGVHLPEASWGGQSQWAYWLDEALANSVFFGRSDAIRLAGYGNTVAGAEGPFRNGVVNTVCLELDVALPQDVGVGDVLRIENERWPLVFVGVNKKSACIGAYSAAQISAAMQRLGKPGEVLTGVWFERGAAPGESMELIHSNFYEAGAFKINGIYLDRPAVILKTGGRRFGIARRQLPEVGDVLEFFSSGARKVVAVYPTGYVELDRGDLDPYQDGYPRPIKVHKSAHGISGQGPYRAKRAFAGGVMLVPPGRLTSNLTGAEISIPEAGRTYHVVAIQPDGMIFLSDFLPSGDGAGTTPRVVWYHVAVGPNWYYRKDKESPKTSRDSPATIWSTYTGLPDAIAGQLNPSGTDYIIHALGQTRKQYLNKFLEVSPEYFVSMRSIPIATWNSWLLINHWDLFRLVLERYKITATSLHSIYWSRQENKRPLRMQTIYESDSKAGFELSEKTVGCAGRKHEFVEIDVRYRFSNHLAWLPVLGGSPRAFVYLRGGFSGIPVSLKPMANHVTFPALFLCGGSPGEVGYGVEGLGAKFAELEIEHVNLRRIESHHPDLEEVFGITQASKNTSFTFDAVLLAPKVSH